jgi:two-component system KDP operon response regulator KdpE
MQPASIQVIDGDPVIQQLLYAVLTSHGYRVEIGRNVKEGRCKFRAAKPDLVLLEIYLPDGDGLQICRELVGVANIPIILVTSETNEDKLVTGLEIGAADYVTKPFNSRILLARINAALRAYRPKGTNGSVVAKTYSDNYLSVNLDNREVQVQGQKVKLTPTEFHLLSHLLTNAGRICTYRELLEKVWGWEYHDNVAYLYTYVRRLRAKLQPSSDSPNYIVAERQIGYRFVPP